MILCTKHQFSSDINEHIEKGIVNEIYYSKQFYYLSKNCIILIVYLQYNKLKCVGVVFERTKTRYSVQVAFGTISLLTSTFQ